MVERAPIDRPSTGAALSACCLAASVLFAGCGDSSASAPGLPTAPTEPVFEAPADIYHQTMHVVITGLDGVPCKAPPGYVEAPIAFEIDHFRWRGVVGEYRYSPLGGPRADLLLTWVYGGGPDLYQGAETTWHKFELTFEDEYNGTFEMTGFEDPPVSPGCEEIESAGDFRLIPTV